MEVERLWPLAALAAALVLVLVRGRKRPYLLFPGLDAIPESFGARLLSWVLRAAPLLLLATLALLAVRPHFPALQRVKYTYGADIVFLLDESGSMAESFRRAAGPSAGEEAESKFAASTAMLRQFMENRRTGADRYGLTAFGNSAVRVLSLSTDHELFLRGLNAQRPVLVGTFFDHPLSYGLEELMDSDARSRILVLVSDGGGPLQDEEYGFSRIIRGEGIRFYWIALERDPLGAVTRFLEALGPLGRHIDATNPAELGAAFEEIHSASRSLIPYEASGGGLLARLLVGFALALLTLLWGCNSLLVYRRRAGAVP